MTHTLTTLALCLLFSTAYAQIPGKKTTTPYTAANGVTYHVGDTIYFLTGSMPNGDFAYAINQSILAGGEKANLPASLAGYRMQIRAFRTQGNRSIGFKSYAVVNPSAINYAVDIEQALKAGEIRVGHLRKETTLK